MQGLLATGLALILLVPSANVWNGLGQRAGGHQDQ